MTEMNIKPWILYTITTLQIFVSLFGNFDSKLMRLYGASIAFSMV